MRRPASSSSHVAVGQPVTQHQRTATAMTSRGNRYPTGAHGAALLEPIIRSVSGTGTRLTEQRLAIICGVAIVGVTSKPPCAPGAEAGISQKDERGPGTGKSFRWMIPAELWRHLGVHGGACGQAIAATSVASLDSFCSCAL